MSYNEKLADRSRQLIALTHDISEEKKMCIGVEKDRLMIRLDPKKYDKVMEKEGCKPMDYTSKVMKGYVFVDEAALTTKKKLEYWVKLALEYNKIAKTSKKKKK
jgi:TfoX/Sxy family transcriptional regulator of competence genes